MNNIERAAAEVSLPLRGTIWSDDTSTTDQYFDVEQTVTDPVTSEAKKAFFRGRYVTIQALSADVYLQFTDDNTDTITPTAAAGDLAAANCLVIPAGQDRSFYLPRGGGTVNFRYIVYRTASGTGSIRIYPSSPPGF